MGSKASDSVQNNHGGCEPHDEHGGAEGPEFVEVSENKLV